MNECWKLDDDDDDDDDCCFEALQNILHETFGPALVSKMCMFWTERNHYSVATIV